MPADCPEPPVADPGPDDPTPSTGGRRLLSGWGGTALFLGVVLTAAAPVSAPQPGAAQAAAESPASFTRVDDPAGAAAPAATVLLPPAAPPAVAAAPVGHVTTGSAPAVRGIPAPALAAYRAAAASMAGSDPGCGLPWELVAAIGQVESGHARGGRVDATGATVTPILGPRLDGGPGIMAIRDTDAGRLDGDVVWDRAVGPMQFIPSTWRSYAADGNADGRGDPHNVHDAALAAGRYLCAGGADLRTPGGAAAAVFRYNRSGAYVRKVLGLAAAYAGGVVAEPVVPSPARTAAAAPGPAGGPGPAPLAQPAAAPPAPVVPATPPVVPVPQVAPAVPGGPVPPDEPVVVVEGAPENPTPTATPTPTPTPTPVPTSTPTPTPTPTPTSPTPTSPTSTSPTSTSPTSTSPTSTAGPATTSASTVVTDPATTTPTCVPADVAGGTTCAPTGPGS